jgi:hypothetical protein
MVETAIVLFYLKIIESEFLHSSIATERAANFPVKPGDENTYSP